MDYVFCCQLHRISNQFHIWYDVLRKFNYPNGLLRKSSLTASRHTHNMVEDGLQHENTGRGRVIK